jgi:Fe-Mn family superoxide dismutase
MTFAMKPLSCDPARIKGMSERLIISHYSAERHNSLC